MQKTRKSVLMTGLTLLACIAMLVAATFAWFTDSVSNKGNKIQAGNLSVTVTGYNWNPNTRKWDTDTSNVNWGLKTPLITEQNWEPGQYNAKVIEVSNWHAENDPALAAKVDLDFSITDNEKDLSNVLWYRLEPIYTKDGQLIDGHVDTMVPADKLLYKEPSNRPATGTQGVVTMSQIESDATAPVTLYTDYHEGQYVYYLLEYGMYTDANNDYQGGSFKMDVDVKATQAASETDGFGNSDYDKDAPIDFTTVPADSDLNDAIADAKDGDHLLLEGDRTVDTPLTLDKDLTIEGSQTTFTKPVTITESKTVTFEGVAFNVTNDNLAISAQNGNAEIRNGVIERTLDNGVEPAYGYLVDVGNGTFKATGTHFIAPCAETGDALFTASPSPIQALGGLYLDGCVIETDGYGLFDNHATTGEIKNTTFKGIGDKPMLGCFNSTKLNGMVFDGCTFIMGDNSNVTAGNYTIKNSTFDFNTAGTAGTGVQIWGTNSGVTLENNRFLLTNGKTGISLSTLQADMGHDAAQLVMTGNRFEGVGTAAIKVSGWTNFDSDAFAQANDLGGNSVSQS